MMIFCKTIVHSISDFSDSKDQRRKESHRLHRNINIPSPSGGLSLIAVAGEIQKPANVVESASVKPISTCAGKSSRDSGGIGFLEDVGGDVDGLMSCTESLGFESSDERRKDDQMEEIDDDRESFRSREVARLRWRKTIARLKRKEVKKFPPPLSSLNKNGQPSFYLRPVRKDGRLELTEVRINRPEILRASREDGRLRLQLIRSLPQVEEEELVTSHEEEEIQEEEEIKEEAEEEEKVRQWRLPLTNGDGFRRCHEVSNHHHVPLWSHHFVTTSRTVLHVL